MNTKLRPQPDVIDMTWYAVTLEQAWPWNMENVERCSRKLASFLGLEFTGLMMAVRVSITGKETGLGIWDTMMILGRESCIRRLHRAIAMVDAEERRTTTCSAHQ